MSSKQHNHTERMKIVISLAGMLLLTAPAFLSQARASWTPASEEIPEAAGDLDTGFGQGGKVTFSLFGDTDRARAIAIQSDGKIVIGGFAENSANIDSGNFVLVRYNTDGSLDTGFGTGGRVDTDFENHFDEIYALAIQPDGKIVAVGTLDGVTGGGTRQTGVAIARYNSDGSPDSGFAQGAFTGGGKAAVFFTGAQATGFAVALQSDGKIVIAGSLENGSDNTSLTFLVLRLNPDGTRDTGFGEVSAVAISFGHRSEALGVAIQSDGKLVVCGYAQTGATYPDTSDFALARLNPNGSLDTTFGSGGKVTTDFSGHADSGDAIAIQQDGKIVVSGTAQASGAQTSSDFAVARYNTNGSLDTNFAGGHGKLTTDFSGSFDAAEALVIQPDGKLVAAGESWTGSDQSSSRFALARYQADGSLDTTYGSGGKVTTSFSGNGDMAGAVALQQDGKIVLAGASKFTATVSDFALARYQADSDFFITFAQPTVTGSVGTKVRVVININRTGGFAGNVTIDAPSLPTGVRTKPPLPIATTDSSAVVKLKLGGAAASGTYQVTFTVTDDTGRTRTGTVTLNIQ